MRTLVNSCVHSSVCEGRAFDFFNYLSHRLCKEKKEAERNMQTVFSLVNRTGGLIDMKQPKQIIMQRLSHPSRCMHSYSRSGDRVSEQLISLTVHAWNSFVSPPFATAEEEKRGEDGQDG
mmetsp:Transcript_52900/g.103446  ORF Transcript_52900/g.103446 Transcript_52900/m.103446 type:complete len:120 (-) Transcript_52900:811-1170(-)